MNKYPVYKDSCVDWIEEIPKHWSIIRADAVFELKKNLIKKNELNGHSVFHYSIPAVQEYGTGMIEEGQSIDSDKFIVEGDEILFSKLNPRKETITITEKKEILSVASTEFLVLQPKAILLKFGYYLFKSNTVKERISSTVQSATKSHQRANPSDIFKLWIQTPSITEQSQIATFLDHKTSQIDDLIEKKQKLIELLKEERTAIINQAVTKGLNPDAPMKDSGIEWLGSSPVNWGLKRLKQLVDPKLQYGANEIGIEYNPTYPRYIRITDFDQDGNLRNDTLLSLDPQIAQNYLLNEGDILFARSGATVGKTFIYRESTGNACFAGYLIKATTIKDVLLPDFLYYLTQSNYYDNWKESIFSQATIQNIGADKYQDFLVPLPSMDEQKEIVSYIDDKSENIKSSIIKIQKEIELISEYKNSLINEAVTGKIDVRDYQINHA